LGLAAAETGAESYSGPGFLRVGQSAEDGLNDLTELLGGMRILKKYLRFLIDLGGFTPDDLAKVGGKNGIIKVTMEDLFAGLTSPKNAHYYLLVYSDTEPVTTTLTCTLPYSTKNDFSSRS
jgi:hypothetical protein